MSDDSIDALAALLAEHRRLKGERLALLDQRRRDATQHIRLVRGTAELRRTILESAPNTTLMSASDR